MLPLDQYLVAQDEYVLQYAARGQGGDSAFEQAPEPLLPNYGLGRIRQYSLDLTLMLLLNSKERTLEEFIKIGEEAGLSFVKVWNMSDLGLLEFRLVL
jgi:hypothetical protein